MCLIQSKSQQRVLIHSLKIRNLLPVPTKIDTSQLRQNKALQVLAASLDEMD